MGSKTTGPGAAGYRTGAHVFIGSVVALAGHAGEAAGKTLGSAPNLYPMLGVLVVATFHMLPGR